MGRGSQNAGSFDDDETTEITEVTESATREASPADESTQILPLDRRRHPRYDSTITAVVYTANGSFRTTTRNLSEGGVRLAQALPAEFQFVGLEVLMIEEKTEGAYRYYLFKAKAVGGTGTRDRLQFTWIPAETLTPYRDYLMRLDQEALAGGAAA